MSDKAAALRVLAGQLELELRADGTPANPLVVVPLDWWRNAPFEDAWLASTLIAGAQQVTVALLAGPPTRQQELLIAAATLSLGDDGPRYAAARARAEQAELARAIVPVADIPGVAGTAGALDRLRAAVYKSPRAAIACAQLLRQTAVLGTPAGLAAEAAMYSMLLGGPEFGRWLAERGAPRQREPVA